MLVAQRLILTRGAVGGHVVVDAGTGQIKSPHMSLVCPGEIRMAACAVQAGAPLGVRCCSNDAVAAVAVDVGAGLGGRSVSKVLTVAGINAGCSVTHIHVSMVADLSAARTQGYRMSRSVEEHAGYGFAVAVLTGSIGAGSSNMFRVVVGSSAASCSAHIGRLTGLAAGTVATFAINCGSTEPVVGCHGLVVTLAI